MLYGYISVSVLFNQIINNNMIKNIVNIYFYYIYFLCIYL